jgi:hypothetical protein
MTQSFNAFIRSNPPKILDVAITYVRLLRQEFAKSLADEADSIEPAVSSARVQAMIEIVERHIEEMV